jgi:hypothetical protein
VFSCTVQITAEASSEGFNVSVNRAPATRRTAQPAL